MKIGRVIGRVVCDKKIDELQGRTLLLVQPLDVASRPSGRALVAVDTVKAGEGDTVMFEGGKEAAQALPNWFNPTDAAVIGIIDSFDADGRP
jgi:ethanolamine utilization protein EutN